MRKLVIGGIALAIAGFSFSGCTSMSDAQLLAAAREVGYGAELPENWQDLIKRAMEYRLKDPSSAVYKFGVPFKGALSKAPIEGGGFDSAGWIVRVQINAKNSYGGYVGFQPYEFMIRDGVVIRINSNGFWTRI